MPDFCTCGAQLPPDARFCHKCAKPQFDFSEFEKVDRDDPVEPLADAAPKPAAPPEIGFRNRTAVRIGFFAALGVFLLISFPLPPFVQIVWLLVCSMAAGFFATLVYTRRTHQRLSVAAGARMGWITGIFSFTISMIFFTATVVSLSSQGGLTALFRAQLSGHDPNMEQVIQQLENPAVMSGVLLFTLLVLFFFFTLLPMAGGALCAKFLERE